MKGNLLRVSPAERLAVEDVLGRYVWAVDTGDAAAVVALFTDDAVVRYGDGRRFEGPEGIRAFARSAIGNGDARGRMHLVHPLFAERDDRQILLRSYIMVPQATAANGILLKTLRYVEDRFLLTETGWRIHERAIFVWDGASLPAAVHAGVGAVR